MVWFHMVRRKMPLTQSAPPARARPKSAGQSDSLRPKKTMPMPHTVAATMTPSPCRCTRAVQRPVTVAISAPTAGAV